MKGVKTELSEKAQAWIVAHYKHTKNAEIAAKWGISETTLHRFARAHGLKKTPQQMRKTQAEAAAAARASHLVHGTYPPKGFRIPRAEEFQFKAGVTSEQRLGKKGEAERLRKSAESRRRTWKLEKGRALFGLPRETKLAVVRHPREHALRRYALKRHGYQVARGGYDVYYGKDTVRSVRLERWPFRFHELQTTN